MIGTAFTPDVTSALQTLLAVSVLMAIVLVARRSVAKHFGAGVAYALWAIPVARLILPPLHIPVSLMPLLRLPSAAHGASEQATTLAIASASGHAEPALTITPSAPVMIHPDPLTDMMPEGLTSPESLSGSAFAMLLPSLLILWAGGALVFFGLSLWRQHEFMQTVRREAVSVSPRLQRTAQQVSQQVGLKRLPVIASSFISSGPLVTGLLRPVVLLPAWFETDYDDVQQRAALAHELTHVRRGDLWALQLAELFVACLWFNPLAYYARRAFRTDQEAACDADVLKTGTASPHAYGATLIKAVKSASLERLPAAAGLPLTHALKERLSRMTHPAPTRTRRLMGGAAATVLGAAALAATSSVTASAGEKEHRELRIDGGTVYLNGELIDDRQIVILGEPFKDIEPGPEFDAEIARLSAEMAEDGARIGQITAQITTDTALVAFSPDDDPEFRALMDELNELPVVFDFNSDNDGVSVSLTGEMSEEDWEAWGAKWEAWGAQIEARADAIEARAEAASQRLEPRIEKMTAEIEARMEAKAAEMDALIEKKFGPEFETRIEITSDAIDGLVTDCRDADLGEGETRIMTREIATPNGKQSVKIACVKGNATALRSARTLAVIEKDKALCADDRQSFRDQIGKESELDGSDE
jgi:beta-lactamase regulating signal transducer with metallopeptidase domain